MIYRFAVGLAPGSHPGCCSGLRHTLGTFLQETMGDARLTAETLGHRGLASVSGYTKITDSRRREAYEEMQQRGLSAWAQSSPKGETTGVLPG